MRAAAILVATMMMTGCTVITQQVSVGCGTVAGLVHEIGAGGGDSVVGRAIDATVGDDARVHVTCGIEPPTGKPEALPAEAPER